MYQIYNFFHCIFVIYFRNALSLEMMSVLVDSINNDRDNPSLRAIVLSANGPVFSAGHNLKELVRYVTYIFF